MMECPKNLISNIEMMECPQNLMYADGCDLSDQCEKQSLLSQLCTGTIMIIITWADLPSLLAKERRGDHCLSCGKHPKLLEMPGARNL